MQHSHLPFTLTLLRRWKNLGKVSMVRIIVKESHKQTFVESKPRKVILAVKFKSR